MEIKTRMAQRKDAAKISEMLVDIGALHQHGRPDIFRSNAQKYDEAAITAMLDDEKAPIIVAVDDDDNVIGYSFCQLKEIGEHTALKSRSYLYVDDFCVDTKKQHSGIGTVLMHAVFDYARSIGLSHVELNVWEFNKNAFAFYEKLGMKTQRREMEIDL